MTGRPEDIASLIESWRADLERMRTVAMGTGRELLCVTVDVGKVEELLAWWSTDAVAAACVCPCHGESPPPGLTHTTPCCELVTEMQVLEEQEELRVRQAREWAALPTFSEVVSCPKCGNGEAVAIFCSSKTRVAETLFGPKQFQCDWTVPAQRDHLHRVCARCRFPWTERPLDDDREGV